MNILVAEDDGSSRLLIAATLRKLGHTVTTVTDGAQAWQSWRDGDFEVVISDWMMPDVSGIELCTRIRAEHRLRYTYLILLTSLAGRGRFLEGMAAGADDFVTKPLDGEQLAARLHVAQRILALHESLRLAAMQDRMTGAWNRTAILDFLGDELARARRDGTGVGVLLIDLDHFKAINDSVGHIAGDDVIRAAAVRMGKCGRRYDRFGRYGGEEFLLVAPRCGTPEAAIVAERVRRSLADAPVETAAGTLQVTISVGVAVWEQGQPAEVTALVAAADAALYRAKRGGRNRVEFA